MALVDATSTYFIDCRHTWRERSHISRRSSFKIRQPKKVSKGETYLQNIDAVLGEVRRPSHGGQIPGSSGEAA